MSVDSSPLVSVVTPVYNGEKYLAECIESVLAQTYQNWEYIIVNNCSTDRTLEIAEEYAQRDSRIRVHDNQEFLSLNQNWNHTLRQIANESKFCKVVHADDWLFPECISRMVEVAETHPTVSLVGAYRLNGDWVKPTGAIPYRDALIPGKEICRWSFSTQQYMFGSPTSLLIRSDLIRSRQPFYKENILHPDTEICFDILQNTDFGFVYQVLTYTRLHEASETSSIQKLDTYILEWLAILQKYGPIYLSKEEYKKRLKLKIQQYYRLLGQRVFQRRGKEFWNYHKTEFKRLGYSFSRVRLFWGMFYIISRSLIELLRAGAKIT